MTAILSQRQWVDVLRPGDAYVAMDSVYIGSRSGLLHIQHQAITETNFNLLSIKPSETNSNEIVEIHMILIFEWIKMKIFF